VPTDAARDPGASDHGRDAPGPPEDAAAPLGRAGAYAKGVARRQEILDRAITVFAERGASRASLRSIARALGVSHAALLHYFDSREQLLVAVYDHAARRGATAEEVGAVQSLTDAAAGNVAVPGLVELYSTLVATSLEADSDAARGYISTRFANLRASIAVRVREEQAEGRVRDDVDAEEIAALLIAASDGLQIQWLLDGSVPLAQTLGAFHALLAPR
jgi:TetR/AcrR family transcriptional regulator, transcriptional repressor of aconitase